MKLCKKIPAKNFCQDHVLFLQGCFWPFLLSHACAWIHQCRFSCDCLWNPDVGILVRNIGQFCRMSRILISYFSSSIAQRQVCNWSKIASLRDSFSFSESWKVVRRKWLTKYQASSGKNTYSILMKKKFQLIRNRRFIWWRTSARKTAKPKVRLRPSKIQ